MKTDILITAIFFEDLTSFNRLLCVTNVHYMIASSKGNNFLRPWPFVRGIQQSPVDSPYRGQWRGALMLSLICARTSGWANNRDAGDFRRHSLWRHCNIIFAGAVQFKPVFGDNIALHKLVHPGTADIGSVTRNPMEATDGIIDGYVSNAGHCNYPEYFTLRWRHNGHDGLSNHQLHGCLLNLLFGRTSK